MRPRPLLTPAPGLGLALPLLTATFKKGSFGGVVDSIGGTIAANESRLHGTAPNQYVCLTD